RRKFTGRAEGVLAALDDQHRSLDVGKMPVTTLVGLAGRMQRISEEHKSSDRKCRIRRADVSGDTSTHRLAADEERALWASRMNRGDHRAIARVEDRASIR